MNYDNIQTWVGNVEEGIVNAIIETPKGSRNKYIIDKANGLFKLKKVLPEGMVFPNDFGFIPHTLAPDKDEIDIMVLNETPTFCGCLVEARIIGMFELKEDTSLFKSSRKNNRILGVPYKSQTYQHIQNIDDLDKKLVEELTLFFITYPKAQGKSVKISETSGVQKAIQYIAENIIDNYS